MDVGRRLQCIVERITDFGAFMTVPGLDYPGLVLIPDLSWGTIRHPSDVVTVGQRLELVVLNHDVEGRRLSLGRKQLTPDPWAILRDQGRLSEGTTHRGARVTAVMDYGVFIEIAEHVEALVHVSQLNGATPAVGARLDVQLTRVDVVSRKIGAALIRG
ncbi:MAG: S1 RNA-binding domain-containing protein [Myxococcota bacterium]